MTTVEVLEKALELLGPNGENWFQIKDGVECGSGELCAYIALGQASRSPDGCALFGVDVVLRKAVNYGSIIRWNDTAAGWPVIKAGFESAIELAKSEAGQ